MIKRDALPTELATQNQNNLQKYRLYYHKHHIDQPVSIANKI